MTTYDWQILEIIIIFKNSLRLRPFKNQITNYQIDIEL